MTTIVQTEVASKGSFWSATLLVSGTCIGGGMLAMPIQTAETGFFLSMAALLICWVFMTFTGLLLVEATLWVRNEAHFSSLSRILVGNGAKVLALCVYLFMNYASLVAYVAGGAALINSWGKNFTGMNLGYEASCLIFTLLFGFIVYLGAQFVGRLNLFFMIALAMAYFGLIAFGIGSIRGEYLSFRPAWRECFGSFSMILATFSYQMIVPSVCSYLKYDTQQLKRAIITGTTIPGFVYILWIFIIHGAIPLEGANSLREAWTNGSSATVPLRACLNHWSLVVLADGFAFLAIVTSFFGLSLALFHFLKDCFAEIKITLSRQIIVLLTFIPTIFLSVLFPRALLQSLDISGGFGDTILSGLIPISMVWMGRYRKGLTSEFKVPGGKIALVAAFSFFLCILSREFIHLFR